MMAPETGGYRSYFEAYQRRNRAKGRALDAVFVEKGALRAVKVEPAKLYLERKMIDRGEYTEFLEEQLERVCSALLKTEQNEAFVEAQVKSVREENDAVRASLERRLDALEKRQDQLQTVEKHLDALQDRLCTDQKRLNFIEPRLEALDELATKARVESLERQVRQLSDTQRVDDLERALQAAIIPTERYNQLECRLEATEEATTQLAQASTRHADERNKVVVQAISDLEGKLADIIAKQQASRELPHCEPQFNHEGGRHSSMRTEEWRMRHKWHLEAPAGDSEMPQERVDERSYNEVCLDNQGHQGKGVSDEEMRHNGLRYAESRHDEGRYDELRVAEPRHDDSRQSEKRCAESCHNDACYDESSHNEAREDEIRYREAHVDENRHGEARRESYYNGADHDMGYQSDARVDESRHTLPRHDECRYNEARYDKNRQSEARYNEDRFVERRDHKEWYDGEVAGHSERRDAELRVNDRRYRVRLIFGHRYDEVRHDEEGKSERHDEEGKSERPDNEVPCEDWRDDDGRKRSEMRQAERRIEEPRNDDTRHEELRHTPRHDEDENYNYHEMLASKRPDCDDHFHGQTQATFGASLRKQASTKCEAGYEDKAATHEMSRRCAMAAKENGEERNLRQPMAKCRLDKKGTVGDDEGARPHRRRPKSRVPQLRLSGEEDVQSQKRAIIKRKQQKPKKALRRDDHIGYNWPNSVMHCGPLPRRHAWVPAVKVATPRPTADQPTSGPS